ncbi:hypothetical protein ACFQ1S_29165, partial [Kibdelosporangium lantanae]
MPPALLALAIGAFGIGTTEFVIMGLLPEVAGTFDVSIPTAGLLQTIALYDPIRSDPHAIQNLEHGLTPRNGQAPAVSDSVDLLCDPTRPQDSAVLVSEMTLANYNVGRAECPNRATRALDVVYPTPTVALDHP